MVYTFACTVGCFINDDWDLIERVVDFKPLEDKEHEGVQGGEAFFEGARKCGGLDKISIRLLPKQSVFLPQFCLPLHQHYHQQHLC